MSDFIADLHCDLLCYLAHDKQRSPFDRAIRCSIPQLQEGGVKLQVLAIYTSTSPKSLSEGMDQVRQFQILLHDYPDIFTTHNGDPNKTVIIPSIENASAFFDEDESLEEGFNRIIEIQENDSKIAYLSMTWNEANRFGGGAHTQKGITHDGKLLLEFLNERQIPIDLSHASDNLAHDILNEIDKSIQTLSIIASHSNARKVHNATRNLPDELISEVINRNGLIGLNFVDQFLGGSILPHVEHILNLGGHDCLAFGADFFYGMDVPQQYRRDQNSLFSSDYQDASVYPKILEELEGQLHLDKETIRNIAWNNANKFLEAEVYGSLTAAPS
ncbi:MAG: membrane dipeptidase [Chlamydiota bacterium]